MALLTLDGLHLSFGGVAALAGVSLEVNANDFFAIIGPNGAGKTSIFNCISGIYAPTRGRILFNGQDITPLKPHRRAKLQIARTFQNIALFKGMTVLDNLKIGNHIRLRSGVLACGLYYGKAAREEFAHRATIEREIIDLLELQEIRHKIVGTLPYGLQKRVELARALALDPTLLLLDEPTAGMNAEETEDMVRFILYVKQVKRPTVVMIEHDMGVVMDISDRYPVPPPPWTGWRREAPPQWEPHYGREWHEEAHERNWREREERWGRGEGRGCPPGLAKQGRC